MSNSRSIEDIVENDLYTALKKLAILCEINQWGSGTKELSRAWAALNEAREARGK